MRKLLLRGQSEHLRLPPSKKSHLRAFPNVLFDLFSGDAYLVTILIWSYTSAMIHWKFKYYIFIHTTKNNFLHVVLNMYFNYTVGNRFLKDSCKDSLKHLLSVTLLLKTGQLLRRRIALLSPPSF